MKHQLHSDASAQRSASGQAVSASGNESMKATMVVNNPHNLIGAKSNGGADEF
jgi:hypothetical protein